MDGTADLLEIVDRQFDRAAQESGGRVVLATYRLLELMSREVRLSGILKEVRDEANERLKTFQEYQTQTRLDLLGRWSTWQPRVEALRDRTVGQRHFDSVLGTPAEFGSRLQTEVTIEFSEDGWMRKDPSGLDRLFNSLSHWMTYGLDDGLLPEGSEWEWLGEMSRSVEAMKERHRHALNRLKLDDRTLAGPAFERLARRLAWLNPPPAVEGDPDWISRYVLLKEEPEARDAIYERREFADGSSERAARQLTGMEREIRQDLAILHEEIRTRILLGRSRLSLVRRFAGRCERYEAERLRRLSTVAKRGEAVLTLELARYLYDHGVNPLLDPVVAGLKPDVLDPSDAPVYVEAKKYARNPADVVRKAVWQVWDTWGRLEKTYPLKEGFLVIFRVGGSLLHLPDAIRSSGRSLYLAVVDLVPSERAGSRQRVPTATLVESDLVPSASQERPTHRKPKVDFGVASR